MRFSEKCLLVIVITATFAALIGCEPKPEQANETEEPLLLLEEGDDEESAAESGPMADNSRCHVCHINYDQEKLTLIHAGAEIGCEKCHGASDAHCSDEDNITPPDIMYPADKIVGFCTGCHARDKIDIRPHKKILAGTATEKKYCTDCHGKHRLEYRTRRWDKTTGELLEDDKVRMTTDDTLKTR